jgi:hypothetical protein
LWPLLAMLAGAAVPASEPLSLDAQRMHQAPSGADVTTTTPIHRVPGSTWVTSR